jgi:hypothetical protein
VNSHGASSARAVIEQIWYRARINAFAHRAAHEECSQQARGYFRREILASLVAILLVILVYLFSTELNDHLTKSLGLDIQILSILATFGSIVATLYSLYQSVMANYEKLDVRGARHAHLLNLYQFIAQRAREVKWPDMPSEDVIALLKDLERDFALLKATGSEPEDRHFVIAHGIVKKIQGEKEAQIAQSFPVGVAQEAQHIGVPTSALPTVPDVPR